jgi:hypothetical protein
MHITLKEQEILSTVKPTKLIAMYFPQFHEIEENNRWWGQGFTDWDNVQEGTPQFEGHYQPRVPLDKNYYDQSELATLEWQIKLAKVYGLYGFCHYHYWFDGKQLLESPSNLVLENMHLDFPFCLSWANETWSRRWGGRDKEILIEQTHPANKASWKKHFDYLIKFWQDPRAIKVDGKPVFVIYRPQYIESINEMISYWQQLAVEHGLPGLYIIHQQSFVLPNPQTLNNFDAVFHFQPAMAINAQRENDGLIPKKLLNLFRLMPEKMQDYLRSIKTKLRSQVNIYDYDTIWQSILTIPAEKNLTTYPGGFVDWDNTARYKNRATIYKGASPEKFAKWLRLLVDGMDNRNLPESFIFLNAWNEWSEGAYLEPDEKYKYAYLESIKRVLSNTNKKT